MSFPLQKIGKHTEKIETWNPNKSISDDLISYIDLSSVDKDKKKIDLSWIQKVLPKEAPSRARQIVKAHDILVSTVRPNLNGIAVVPEKLKDATASTGYCVLRAKTTTLFSQYLFYWLQTKFFINDMISKSTGANYPAVSDKIIKESFIPLPALAEQKQIAAILDAADSLRQKDQQLVEHYNALSQSIFLEMFGDPVTNPMRWDLIKLRDICGVGSSKRVFVNEFVDRGVPFYRGTEVGHLGSGKSIKPHLFISEQHYERLKEESGVPEIGDLLLPSICHDGRIWRVTTKKPFYFKDGRVLWIKVDNDTINGEYLRYFLKGLFLTNYSNYASGTTFAELKIVALKGMGILNPPIKLQNQFAERVAIIEQQKQQAQTNLQNSEALFNSLLQRAFTGELTADKAA